MICGSSTLLSPSFEFSGPMGRQGLLAAVLAPANRTIGFNHNHLHRAALGIIMTIGILRHIPILALLG